MPFITWTAADSEKGSLLVPSTKQTTISSYSSHGTTVLFKERGQSICSSCLQTGYILLVP